jgi:hypothetical protein
MGNENMAIETLDDIVEQLADEFGIYGADRRPCWVSGLTARIRETVETEAALSVGRAIRRSSRLDTDLEKPLDTAT